MTNLKLTRAATMTSGQLKDHFQRRKKETPKKGKKDDEFKMLQGIANSLQNDSQNEKR